MNERGASAGPWLAVGLAFGLPALYFVRVLSATWTPYHTAIVLAIGGAVAWRFAGVFGVGAEHALRNRRARDDSRTTTMIEAVARPALTDGARADLYEAQAAAVRAGLERDARPVERARRPRVSVWGDVVDEGDDLT